MMGAEKIYQNGNNTAVEIEGEKTIIKGFLVVSKLPSYNILKVFLPKIFDDTKIGYEAIQVVRGYFYNKIIRLAQKYYEILNKYAVNVGFGYIIPPENVKKFMSDIEKLRKEYEKCQSDFEKFIKEGKIPEGVRKDAKFDREYINKVIEYLREKGVSDEIKIPDIVSRFKVRLIPLSLSMDYIIDYIDEETKEIVEREISIISQEILKKYEEELNEKMKTIIKKLENYQNKKVNKRFINSLKREMEQIEILSKNSGVDISNRIDALKEVINNIENNKYVTASDVESVRVNALKSFI